MLRDKLALIARSGLLLFGVLLTLALAGGSAWAEEPPPVTVEMEEPATAPPAEEPTVTLRRCAEPAEFNCRWTLALEGGISLYEDPEGILGEAPPAGVTPFNWGLHEFDAAFCFRATAGFRLWNKDRIEARVSYLGSWDDSSRQTGQFVFRANPGAASLLSPVASADLESETTVWGGELNWWRNLCCQPRWQFDWGVGARLVRVDDEAEASNWVGLAANSHLSGEVENAFLGLQVMGAVRSRPSPNFEFGVSAKVLLGWMSRDMTESDTSILTGGLTGDASVEDTDFSWGFEAELSLLYRVIRRIIGFLEELEKSLGDRHAVLARELTKIHEEFLRGPLSELIAELKQREGVKGECTLIVSGAEAKKKQSLEEIENAITHALAQKKGSLSMIAKTLALEFNLPRQKIYEKALHLQSINTGRKDSQ